MDTLAWARRGAIVTGVDLSENSIALARSLSHELNLPARFICTDIYRLIDSPSSPMGGDSQLLDPPPGEFDIVFTSYGVLHWLHDLRRWGEIIAYFLKPNGVFYIVEDHPTFRLFSTEDGSKIKLANPYFFSETPDRVEMTGSYATGDQGNTATFYIWNHSLGDVINALIDAGLTIEYVHEFPFAARAKFPFMEQGVDGWWRLPTNYIQIPFLFSLRAHR